MTTDFFGNQNVFSDFLEQDPLGQRAAFFAQEPRFGQTPNMRRFFQGQFQNIHNQFLGRLGEQILGGQVPTERFTDFLGNFPFQEQFLSMAPGQRGGLPTNVFNPRTRSLFF